MSAAPDAGQPPARLFRSTSVVSAMTLLSRISGLARDIGFSRWFGAGLVTDAFFVAFKIPNLLRRFFAEGAFAQAFVPVISEYRSTRSAEEARDLLDRVTGTLALALFVVTAIGVLAAPVLIMIFAPGFLDDNGRFELASDMLRLTFPYIFFISLTALAGGILNTYRRFAVPAFTPVLLNLVLIVFAGWIAPQMERPGIGLALGVFVAGFVQLAFQAPFLLRLKLLPRPRWGWAHEGVRRIGRLMLPAIFGSSVAQINILFDTLIASFLIAGSISWLYYSDRLVEFPLGVFGIALATVILPHLSEQHARASRAQFSAMLDWALKLVLLVALPAAIGLALLAAPLIATIFYGGEFTEHDVRMTAASLTAYAPGLIAFILVKVLAPGYFARQDMRTPVRIGVQALVLNMFLNVVFVVTLVITGWAPAHVGLAAATALSSFYNAAMLYRGLRENGVYQPGTGWRSLALKVAAGCAVMTVFVIWLAGNTDQWLALATLERIGWLAACVLGAIAVYFVVCFATGLRPRELLFERPGA
jgi:putative peptidoglycan lipid II flippase